MSSRLNKLLLFVAATMSAVAAGAPEPPFNVKDIAARKTSYEPTRVRLQLTTPLPLDAAKGLATLPSGTIVIQTRQLRTKNEAYAYIVTEDGASTYGLVQQRLLDAASKAASPPPTPRGLLGALAALSPGRNKQDKFGSWTENAGVKNLAGAPAPKAVAITVDLCPNFQHFDAGLFDELADLGKARGKPLPVTAFLSGYWLKGSASRRTAELKRLTAHAQSGDLDLTAANHSLTHPYLQGAVSYARNFLLKPGTDMNREVLGNELAILGAGFIPAPYFRFPGLISDAKLERAVRETFSLIVVGKGSWPGIGDRINLGDVVLVHGNGGEPGGVTKLIDWLRGHRAEIVAGKIDFAAPNAFIPE